MDIEKVDAKENTIIKIDKSILEILLKDNTTKRNIIWATDIYTKKGISYGFDKEILIEQITGYYGMVIKPRILKSKEEQQKRIKDKAEVFTPSWICNKQNNLIDNEWFGKKEVFNKEELYKWDTINTKIEFPNNKKWQDYVNELRIEISCGEAPYLVSRYDTVTGEIIEVKNRIGLLDRKLRVINENVDLYEEWLFWVKQAYKSIYGYEWQGDSLLIARENLLYTFIDNYKIKFLKEPTIECLKEIAEIISWNIWQMDGLKYVIPNTCKNFRVVEYTLFGEEVNECICPGCKKGNDLLHNGKYAKIMNWETKRAIKYITVVKRSGNL